jgi:hypothetical protein
MKVPVVNTTARAASARGVGSGASSGTVYIENNKESRDRSRSRDKVKPFVDIKTEVNTFNDADLVIDLNVEDPVIPKNRHEVNRAIKNIETDVGQLTDNIEYVSIMEDLDRKLQEIIDRSNPPAFMKEGGSKKRRTKKAKKHIKKRRYSRKH